ncbi:MAG: hypothetical protein C4333_00245 [Meiothermus sp.]
MRAPTSLFGAALLLGLGLAQPVRLTGNPVPPSFVEQSLRRALGWSGLEAPALPALPPLEYGQQRLLSVGVARVTLEHAPYPPHRTTQLLLSNAPETVTASRGLFHYRFAAGEGVRLVYHHKNGSPGPLDFELRLSNPTDQEVEVWVSDAAGGPVADELYAGHVATKRWLELYWNQVGQFVEIPPYSTRTLLRLPSRGRQAVSGLLEAVVTRGPAVALDLVARGPGEADPPLETYAQSPAYRFDSLEKRIGQTHIAGKGTLMTLGEGAFENGVGKAIKGSWGVLYTYELLLQNPSEAPRTVGLRLSAAGGIARGVVWLEGQGYELPLLRPGQPYELIRVTLNARSERRIRLSTLPAAGSNYPIRLLLYDPLATASPGPTGRTR